MLSNQDAIDRLHEDSKVLEKGMSSYWIEMLRGFEFKNGAFSGKGLPEGEGGSADSMLSELVHYLLQSPYRKLGKRFPAFDGILKTAKSIHQRRGNRMRLGTLRQAITLAFLDEQSRIAELTEPIVIIGDGFGSMASLVLSHFQGLRTKIVLINLTPNLLIDAVYVQKSVPGANVALVVSEADYLNALVDEGVHAILVQADNASIVSSDGVGLAINIASMQEMVPNVIAEYFSMMRSSKNPTTLFYCVNRINKTLPDGTPVNFFEYPWDSEDKILIDELCPWHQKYYSGKPPFYFSYDGPHQHRLVSLRKTGPSMSVLRD